MHADMDTNRHGHTHRHVHTDAHTRAHARTHRHCVWKEAQNTDPGGLWG